MDEVSTVLWYLETRLIDAGARARDALVRAFDEEFGARLQPGGARGAAHARQLGRRRSRRKSLRHARCHDRRRAPRQLRDTRPLRDDDHRSDRTALGLDELRSPDRRAARVDRVRRGDRSRRVRGKPASQRRRAIAPQAIDDRRAHRSDAPARRGARCGPGRGRRQRVSGRDGVRARSGARARQSDRRRPDARHARSRRSARSRRAVVRILRLHDGRARSRGRAPRGGRRHRAPARYRPRGRRIACASSAAVVRSSARTCRSTTRRSARSIRSPRSEPFNQRRANARQARTSSR